VKTAIGEQRSEAPGALDCSARAVHARGEQGWKSGHLEPFSFCGRYFDTGTSKYSSSFPLAASFIPLT
jgi:hypothetical protein